MKKHKKIKLFATFLLICVVTVCAFGVVGQTNAYYTGTDSKTNQINVQKVEIEVEEDIVGLMKKSVTITNPYAAPCYVRMKAMVPVIKGLKEYEPNYGDNFVRAEDGFYYLNRVLKSGEQEVIGGGTAPFYKTEFESTLSDITNEEVKLERERIASIADVVIYVEAVQAEGIFDGEVPADPVEAAKQAFAKISN